MRMPVIIKNILRSLLPGGKGNHRIWGGPLRGQRMVTSWRENFSSLVGRTEPDVIAWFEKNVGPGQTWLDVGANYGYTALNLARLVGPSGRVFAFEPKLSTCGSLSQTAELNHLPQITVIPAGLAAPETIEFQRFQTSGSMAVGGGSIDGPSETVMIARLDWLWPRICADTPRIDGVKIDVQGMELGVLRGMTALLAKHTPKLIVELHAGVDRAQLLDHLEHCGYKRKAEPVFHQKAAGQQQVPDRDNLSYAFTPLCRS